MNHDTVIALRVGRNVGVAVGGIGYLALGLVPSFYVGSYGTIALLAKIFGPLDPGILVRMTVVIGTALGLLGGATLCMVGGGALGWLLALGVELFVAKFSRPQKEAHYSTHP